MHWLLLLLVCEHKRMGDNKYVGAYEPWNSSAQVLYSVALGPLGLGVGLDPAQVLTCPLSNL